MATFGAPSEYGPPPAHATVLFVRGVCAGRYIDAAVAQLCAEAHEIRGELVAPLTPGNLRRQN
ncbi:hypothetical protein [Streptomyces sp. NPDC058385]|uniref:hypothetical protein n=1 Tax=Streptomyces sp. NPDC058385 TaxID=3346473 RepID=UPI003653235B